MTVRCAKIDRLLDPYLAQTLDAATREAVDSHLAGCDACRGTLVLMQQASSYLQQLGPASPAAGLADRAFAAAIAAAGSRDEEPMEWLTEFVTAGWRVAAVGCALGLVFLIPALRNPELRSASTVKVSAVSWLLPTTTLDADALIEQTLALAPRQGAARPGSTTEIQP